MKKTLGTIVVLVLAAALLAGVGDEADGKRKRNRNKPHKLVDVQTLSGFADTLASPVGFVDLAGATATVQADRNGTIVARFSAESRCSGSTGGYCSVRVMVDGEEAAPADSEGVRFAATGSGGMQSHSIERSVRGVGRGAHTVTVQWGTSGNGADAEIGAWHLTVESIR